MISFDQASHDAVIEALDRSNCRGYTMMEQTQGRGSKKGEPHLGSHAWPSMNSTVFTVVEDNQVEPLLERLHTIDTDSETPQGYHLKLKCLIFIFIFLIIYLMLLEQQLL